jgi:hypothetical protein
VVELALREYIVLPTHPPKTCIFTGGNLNRGGQPTYMVPEIREAASEYKSASAFSTLQLISQRLLKKFISPMVQGRYILDQSSLMG